MEPGEVRARVLEDHSKIRKRLDQLDTLRRIFEEKGPEIGREIRLQAAELYEVMSAHLSLEDAHLVPALARLPEIGARLADRLTLEHGEQRELLLYLVSRLEQQSHPTTLVVRELEQLAEYLRQDMAHEEATILREDILC